MSAALMKHNPAFLSDEDLARGFVVRQQDLQILLGLVRDNLAGSNQHTLVLGPRGMGKTTLVRRLASAVREDPNLAQSWYPLVFSEEAYQVGTAGELWLEALLHLADQTDSARWRSIYEALKDEPDDERLRVRALASLMDFADEQGKRLLLIIENLQMILGEQLDEREGWSLRHTLQSEPRIMLVATAPMLFQEVSHRKSAFYDLLHQHTLDPLNLDEIRVLWTRVNGSTLPGQQARPLEILTGGNPRLLVILASFAAGRSFGELMTDLVLLVDEHTNYFKANVEALPVKERRVFLALADLWEPSLARAVAREARLEVNEVSAMLHRLELRGAINSLPQKRGKSKLYQLTERIYNLYHLMRRRGGAPARVKAAVEFMVAYYDGDGLTRRLTGLAHEAVGLRRGERLDHLTAYAEVLKRAPLDQRAATVAMTPEVFFELEDLPEELRQMRQDLAEPAALQAMKLAMIARDAGRHDESEQLSRRATELQPNSGLAWVFRGAHFALLGQLAESIECFRHATELAPRLALAWSSLDLALADGDAPPEAVEWACRHALRYQSTSATWPDLLTLHAEACRRLGREQDAEESLRKALELSPSHTPAQHLLGEVLLRQGRAIEAEPLYRALTTADTADLAAWNHLGVTLASQGHMREALVAFRVATTLPNAPPDVWKNLIGAYANLDQWTEAAETLQTLVNLAPQDSETWHDLMVALQRLDRHDEALQAAHRALDLDPQDLDAAEFVLESIVDDTARGPGAASFATYILDHHAHSPDALNVVAWTLAAGSDDPQLLTSAEAWAREALTRDPSKVEYSETHALTLARLKCWPEALAALAPFLADSRCAESRMEFTTQLLIDAAAAGHAAAALHALLASPHAARLEPLVVGLRLAVGEEVVAPQEVLEVARDILRRIQEDT